MRRQESFGAAAERPGGGWYSQLLDVLVHRQAGGQVKSLKSAVVG